MCNSILCFLINDVSWAKVFEDILSGLVLLFVGFEFFKRQKRYESSVQEVKGIADNLELFLKRFKALNFELEKFEDQIRWTYQKDIFSFFPVFVQRIGIGNTVFLTMYQNILGVDENIPSELSDVLPLQRNIYHLKHSGVVLATAWNVLLQSLEKFNSRDPAFSEDGFMRVLNEYKSYRTIFSSHLNFLESIVHKSKHGWFDWEGFSAELKSYKII